MSDFEHFNIMDVDPNFKLIEKGIKQFRLNSLNFKTVTPSKGANVGVETALVDASLSIVNDPEFSGRRIRQTFWLSNVYDQKNLRKLVNGIGVPQEVGESFKEYCERVTALDPKPEFKTFLGVKMSGKDEQGNPVPDNYVAWTQVTSV